MNNRGTINGSRQHRISVVDDDAVVRQTMCLMLRRILSFEDVSEYESGSAALSAFERTTPDSVMLDIQMPGITGIDCAQRISRAHPLIRIVMVTAHLQSEYVLDALRAGAMGYLLKPFTVTDLQQAIQGAIEGRLVLSTQLRSSLLGISESQNIPSPPLQLSPQETAIVKLIAKGLTDLAIAMELGISEYTVKTHLKRLFRKLRVSCRAEAVAKCDPLHNF